MKKIVPANDFQPGANTALTTHRMNKSAIVKTMNRVRRAPAEIPDPMFPVHDPPNPNPPHPLSIHHGRGLLNTAVRIPPPYGLGGRHRSLTSKDRRNQQDAGRRQVLLAAGERRRQGATWAFGRNLPRPDRAAAPPQISGHASPPECRET